jgi:hypothetical protein
MIDSFFLIATPVSTGVYILLPWHVHCIGIYAFQPYDQELCLALSGPRGFFISMGKSSNY